MERQKQILLIGADAPAQRAMADALTRRGCQTTAVVEYREGLRLLSATRPDLIMLDIGNAPSAGWETFERIRALTDAPVILAVARDDVRQLAGNTPNTAILVKPVSAAQVTARARIWGLLCHASNAMPADAWSTHRLNAAELARIDRALSQVGERGEVRLIIQQGRLRFLEKHVTTCLNRKATPA